MDASRLTINMVSEGASIVIRQFHRLYTSHTSILFATSVTTVGYNGCICYIRYIGSSVSSIKSATSVSPIPSDPNVINVANKTDVCNACNR